MYAPVEKGFGVIPPKPAHARMSPDATRRCRASPPPAGRPASGRARTAAAQAPVVELSMRDRCTDMPIRIAPRGIALSTATFLMSLAIAGCSPNTEESSAAYQAACHGPPLRTTEAINQAMEDGYDINRRYFCIDKASFVAVNEERARWEAANTPEARARREAAFAETRARYAEQRAREAVATESSTTEALPGVVLRNIDVNTATEADIAGVISVGPEVAAQVLVERNKRRFSDWADLVTRVVGLGAAQPAAYASICGLTVDGKSLDGALPNAQMAASIARKYQQYQRK